MEQIFIPEKVVLYLESDEQTGAFHDLENDSRAYINADTKAKLVKQSVAIIHELISGGFVTEKRPKNQGLIKKVKTDPPLRVVFIELTKKCNLRCKHCYVPDCNDSIDCANAKEMTFTNINKLISQIDDLGVMELQLTGGELFVLPYAIYIIREAQNRLIPCSIFTNGTLLTEDVFRYISENNYGLIFYVSLDGYQKTHDIFRRSPGAFQKTIKTIHRLLQMDCDVRINTSIGRHNIAEMSQFIQFIKNEFGVLHRLVTVEPIGRADAKMTITAQEFADLLQEGRNSLEFLDSHDSISDWAIPACGIGSSMLFIDAYGNVSFCPTLTQKENSNFLAGNINCSSLKNIWEKSPVFKKFRGIQCNTANQCQFKELCKGGCRSRAYLSNGNIGSPDLAMCLLYNAK
ncbi:MAG: Metallo cofactor biosynthesis protein [Candidatus Azambacteria bacterium GW2011_GWE1_42_9]|nr:MAG: Metallo cofactor biosynthesis protein [Candidatus Azambacteria bacterium GW2011_GWF1_41_10]KKS49309.1 MAG: Metallo cofactor biosynthesis protein [Candidatus Azambacteria bacterium GW2011_GWF2_42_22]KKS69306.1 MAG: Metallo cofactor biosynthesis protein [Candidatus Azambacteria bacterium GW2011_GWA2_42_62]KKS73982.1 MAG: Metallo cofactor biosynthesis protein [Candidatus Azambacteria bacterium GW2011_GWB1_42_72]KKS79800.1 MAG: Metallo cofactor biosynthesis protein [Candidatus Azambacteria 